jgi:hypothetical protein
MVLFARPRYFVWRKSSTGKLAIHMSILPALAKLIGKSGGECNRHVLSIAACSRLHSRCMLEAVGTRRAHSGLSDHRNTEGWSVTHYFKVGQPGALSQAPEFLRGESSANRKASVVDSQRVPSQQWFREPHKPVRNVVSFDVHDQYGALGNATEASKQFDDFFVSEVVEERRAKHVIEAVVLEWKSEGISNSFRMRRSKKIGLVSIDA